MLIKFFLLLVLSQTNQDAGLSPAMAIILENEKDVSNSASASVYYSITASADGILDVTMTPVTGEADLSLVHFSGSPTIESRREGLLSEEISTRVRKGDRYLVRVFSPFGRPATFRLRATVAPASAAPPAAPVATVSSGGKTETTAIEIPSGSFIPVDAAGTRFFKVAVPRGYVLGASLYPIQGEADLALLGSNGRFALSRRPGLSAEHVYNFDGGPGAPGYIVLRVTSMGTGDIRYVLLTRLLHPGLTGSGIPADPEMEPISRSSLDEIWNRGDRMEGSSKVLRLP